MRTLFAVIELELMTDTITPGISHWYYENINHANMVKDTMQANNRDRNYIVIDLTPGKKPNERKP